MFQRNSKSIDFDVLEQRVRRIAARIAMVGGSSQPMTSMPVATPAVDPAPTQPGFWEKARQWLSCLIRLRRIREAAELGRTAMSQVRVQDEQIRQCRNELLRLVEQVGQCQTRAVAHEWRRELDEVAAETARKWERQLSELRREILFQQRRLNRMGSAQERAASDGGETGRRLSDDRHEALYLAFEDAFRGSRQDIKSRLQGYLTRVLQAGAGAVEQPLVDLGCGRGEWLELLKEAGVASYGVDANRFIVERTRTLGFDARHEDLMAHLGALPDMCRSAVTAFHVVEHLPFPVLVDLVDEALRVLDSGGIMILETPNPETIRVGATTFHYDPTHHKPIMPDVLKFILEQRGFVEVDVLRLHPFSDGLLEAKTKDAELLNRVLFGPQDYAVVARRA